MVQNYMTIFGKNPKEHKSVRYPLEQVVNKDLYTSELLDTDDTCSGLFTWIYLTSVDMS